MVLNKFYCYIFYTYYLFKVLISIKLIKVIKNEGFPGGTVVKNPPANAGDMGSSPGLGRSHMLRSN